MQRKHSMNVIGSLRKKEKISARVLDSQSLGFKITWWLNSRINLSCFRVQSDNFGMLESLTGLI